MREISNMCCGCKSRIPEKFVRPVVITASILGLLQGLTWAVLSIIGIATYNGVIKVNANELTTNQMIYKLFLNNHDHWAGPDNHRFYILINAVVFVGFLWFYLVISTVWAIASTLCGIVALRFYKSSKIRQFLKAWATVTILVTLYDVLFTVLLWIDTNAMNKALEFWYQTEAEGAPTRKAYSVITTLAARAYFFMILNFAAAVATCTLASDKSKNAETRSERTTSSEINPLRSL